MSKSIQFTYEELFQKTTREQAVGCIIGVLCSLSSDTIGAILGRDVTQKDVTLWKQNLISNPEAHRAICEMVRSSWVKYRE